MKQLILLFQIVLLAAAAAFAQQQKTSPDSTDEPVTQPALKEKRASRKSVNQSSAPQPAAGVESALVAGLNLEAQLAETLDVKRARVGDEVILTTTKNIKQDGRVVIGKGTRLVGRVTEVAAKTKENGASKLGVVFERLEGRDLSAPISATILSITEARAGAALGDTLATDLGGTATGAGTVSRRSSGGGLLGGVTGAVGGVVNTATSTVGGVAGTATGTSATVGNTLGGLQLSQSAAGQAGGAAVLSAPGKNLRLEKGVTFLLRLNGSAGN